MIQRLGRAGKKGRLSTFILFIPKWSQIRDSKEIEDRAIKNTTTSTTLTTKSQLFNTNRPKYSSPFAQTTIAAETAISDTESIIDSDVKSNKEGEANDSELLFALLAIENEVTNQKKAAKKQKNQSELQKCANLLDEFFDYIYRIPCQCLISFSWYNNIIYTINKATGLGKDLLTLCCNGLSCKSTEPEFLQREPFIKILSTKYSETD